MSRGFDGFEIDDCSGLGFRFRARCGPEFVFFFEDSDRTPEHP